MTQQKYKDKKIVLQTHHFKAACMLWLLICFGFPGISYSATNYLYVGQTLKMDTPSPASGNGYIDNAVLLSSADALAVDTSDPFDVKITVLRYFSNIVTVKVRFVEKYTNNGHIDKVDHDVELRIGAKYPTVEKVNPNVTIKVGETKKLEYKVTPDGLLPPEISWGTTNFYGYTEGYVNYTNDGHDCWVTGKKKGICDIIGLPFNQQSMAMVYIITVVENDSPNPKLSLSANPSGGSVESGTKVYLTASADGSTVYGADIYYTTNGTTPTKSSTKYTSSGISITQTCTLKAIAYMDGYETSEVMTANYTIKASGVQKATCADVINGTDGTVYRVTGTVKSISNTTYGNWYLSDNTGEIYIYGTRDQSGNNGRNNSIEAWGIEEGDQITVEGPRQVYNGLVELVDVAVVDLQKAEKGTLGHPFNAIEANNKASELGVGETTSQSFYVKGIISSIRYLYNAQYGTATFYISDDGSTDEQFYVYGSYYLENKPWVEGNPQISVGDEVIVYGKLTNYNGILEMASKQNYIYSHNGRTSLPSDANGKESITISSAGYATFYSSESAYTLPNGLSAQVVTGAANGKLTYRAIADGAVSGVIPAGVAVMLVSDKKQAGTFTLTSSESTATYTGTNLLHGSDEATTTKADNSGYLFYKLSYGLPGSSLSDVFGWYWGALNGGAFQIEGHKAWLAVPKSAATRGYSIDGETTGIVSICEDDEQSVFYDMQGRHIGKPAGKGVYIKNGKKIIIK